MPVTLLVSAASGFVVGVSYLTIATLVLPRLGAPLRLRLVVRLAVAVLVVEGLRKLVSAVVFLYEFVALRSDAAASVATWSFAGLGVPHAVLAALLAAYGLRLRLPREAP